ncbi:MAG: biotin/lipoyl-binding protein [Pseudomonadota bacterium]
MSASDPDKPDDAAPSNEAAASTDGDIDPGPAPDASILASDGYDGLAVVAEGGAPPPWLPPQDGAAAELSVEPHSFDASQLSQSGDTPLTTETDLAAASESLAAATDLSDSAGAVPDQSEAPGTADVQTAENGGDRDEAAAEPPVAEIEAQRTKEPDADLTSPPAPQTPEKREDAPTAEPAEGAPRDEGAMLVPPENAPPQRSTAGERFQRTGGTMAGRPRASLSGLAGRDELPAPSRRLRPASDGPVIAPQVMAPDGPPSPDPASQRPRRPVQPIRSKSAPAGSERARKQRKPDATRKPARGEVAGGGTVVIDGDLFPLTDWSPEAIGIPGARQFYKLGDRRTLELELDFGDYAVNLDLRGVVVERYEGRTEWLIDEPTRSQKNVLSALSAAALKGANPFDALVSARGGPGVRSRGARRGRYRVLLPLAAIVSLPLNAVIIALIVVVALMDTGDGDLLDTPLANTASNPVVRALHGAVSVPAVRVLSPVDARVTSVSVREGDRVEPGELLMSVRTSEDDSERVSFISPCRCVVDRVLVQKGQPMREGQWVATLYESDVTPTVRALFEPDTAPQVGAEVTVRPTGVPTPIPGAVTAIAPPEGDRIGLSDRVRALSSGAVMVEVMPSRPIPRALAGVPTFVDFTPAAAPAQ